MNAKKISSMKRRMVGVAAFLVAAVRLTGCGPNPPVVPADEWSNSWIGYNDGHTDQFYFGSNTNIDDALDTYLSESIVNTW